MVGHCAARLWRRGPVLVVALLLAVCTTGPVLASSGSQPGSSQTPPGRAPLTGSSASSAAAGRSEGAGGSFTLDQAVTLALDGRGFEGARLALQKAVLEYQQAVASNVLSPSPFAEQTARHTLAQAQNQLVSSYFQTVGNAVGAYLDVLSARAAVQAATLQVQSARIARDTAREKARAGSIGPLELQDAENQLGSAETDLARARLTLDQAMGRLAQVLGYPEPLPSPDALTLPQSLPDPPAMTEKEALQRATQASRELAWRQEAVDIARKQLEQARSEKAPPVQLQVRENALRQEELALEQAAQDLRLSVRTALAQLGIARSSLDVARAKLDLERRRLAGVSQQREMGLKTDQDVIVAQMAVARAEQSYVDAMKAYLTAWVEVNRLTGAPAGFGPPGLLDRLLEVEPGPSGTQGSD